MLPRYTLPPFENLWNERSKWQRVLDVELAVSDSLAEAGVIPLDAAYQMRQRANFDVDKIAEYEKITRHDVIAFLQSVGDHIGEYKRYLHLGLTSYDVIDTALSIALVEAGDYIMDALRKLTASLSLQAVKHKDTLMPGRTHGMHAEPITLGWKISSWLAEANRNIDRWRYAVDGVKFGKLSGAVGTYPNITPDLEKVICAKLGLTPETISTQVIPRDRHAEYTFVIASIGAMCERIALEVRLLQHSEVGELYEPFMKGQRGSSAMPHKKNPVTSENICGLSRMLRSFVSPALENIALWHERDISHSSVERIILPDATSLVYYILNRTNWMIENWVVREDVMMDHLEQSKGLMFSGALLTALKIAGIEDDDIYRRVQEHALSAQSGGLTFPERVKEDPVITQAIGDKLDALFNSQEILKRAHIPLERVSLNIFPKE